jgi:hypothetical protein
MCTSGSACTSPVAGHWLLDTQGSTNNAALGGGARQSPNPGFLHQVPRRAVAVAWVNCRCECLLGCQDRETHP